MLTSVTTRDVDDACSSPRRSRRSSPRSARARLPRASARRVRDGAIVYDEIESAAELPVGWTDVQDGGQLPARAPRRRGALRLRRRAALVEAASCFPPRVRLWQARRERRRPRGRGGAADETPLAFLGVRACELHAIAIQDRVFLGGRYADRDYAARREGVFVVAVNCGEPGGTCFCVSMGTGPTAEAGYDLALTELLDGRAPLPRRGRAASAAPRCSPSCRARRGRAPTTRRGRGARSTDAAEQDGPARSTRRDLRDLLARQPRAPALGRGRRALPHLRQLHDGLPDLLLHDRRGRDRPDRRARRALRASGTPASRSTTRYIHGGSVRPTRPLALPPVADAQARHLARPVRHVGLRRLRPLHHLVPGRHRHHRGGRRDPRDRRGSDACRRLDDAARATCPVFAGLDAGRSSS